MNNENDSYELPKGWVWTRIGDIVNIKYGKDLSVKEFTKEGYPVFGANGVIGFYTKYLYEDEQVMISCRGAYSGKINLSPPKSFITHNSLVLEISKQFKEIKRFLFYALQSADKSKIVTGTAQPQVTINNAIVLEIPLPPLPEQHRIVGKIEELFTKLNAGVKALKKIKTQIKRYREAVLKYAFEGKLTEEWRVAHKYEMEDVLILLQRIKEEKKKNTMDKKRKSKQLAPFDTSSLSELPENWLWTRLGEIAEINPKLPFENIPNDLKVSFLPMKAVEELNGRFDLSLSKKYEKVKKGYTPFVDGDIIFAKITPCMENGKIAVVNNLRNGIGYGSTEFHVIRLIHANILRKYIFFYLIQEDFRKNAQRAMTGSAGQLRVQANYMLKVPLPLLPLLEQHKMVEEIERRFSIADEVEKIVDYNLTQAQRLRQSILKKAFEGKLVRQDPNDEPAAKLLERIKAEKTKREAEIKLKKKGKKKKNRI